ncbi:cell wall assembly protein [Pontibacillus halophilus JSM 076056 = DSM 19796]|uniref:Cell wall assembly protein n=1 Tax=Pontibacillus halophilus JSM 076056 = DSM 19796 TaxID=1385510 RepID=A0A0A5GC39_9BACI|nr:SMI1/KNR4 family protein [Pontibacillus halophilus]KGX88768.1 cell wall assembly protein [Pontibacillus halophilus JSM 076056 = DSM 19796]
MSINTYQKAKELISSEGALADFVGGCSEELIRLAERKLNLSFSPIYKNYLRSFGAGNFGSQEVYGIIDKNFVNSSVPDAIWFTLSEREEIDLPDTLLVIYDTGSDELYCLDFNQIEASGEPKVVSFIPGVNIGDQTYEVIADDFGDYLLDLVEREL